MLGCFERDVRGHPLGVAFRVGTALGSVLPEELLPLPLATVRERLHLPDPRIAHGQHPGEGLLA